MNRRYRIRLARIPSLLIVALVPFLLLGTSYAADKEGQRTAVASKTTTIHIFNLAPGATYTINKNGSLLRSETASFAGRVSLTELLASGDQLAIVLSSVNLDPPGQPTGLAVSGTDIGCADLTWNANTESDLIGYTIYFGQTSVSSGGASEYDDSLSVDRIVSRGVCGLANGTYFFAIKARNALGLMSPYSAEVSADVSNGNTQGPLPPQQVQVSAAGPGCARVVWQPGSEPDLAGYVVYYGPLSVAGGEAAAYETSIDVGNQTSADICQLQPGTIYVAVRTYNTSGLFSGFSTEKALVSGSAPNPETETTIFPNGYWMSDPSRPLEVRGVPSGWTVRIFDTSGFQVRAFTNDQSLSVDWTWDFTNRSGQRVARSLYLIRVVDNSGNVRHKGRFLVQIDP